MPRGGQLIKQRCPQSPLWWPLWWVQLWGVSSAPHPHPRQQLPIGGGSGLVVLSPAHNWELLLMMVTLVGMCILRGHELCNSNIVAGFVSPVDVGQTEPQEIIMISIKEQRTTTFRRESSKRESSKRALAWKNRNVGKHVCVKKQQKKIQKIDKQDLMKKPRFYSVGGKRSNFGIAF